MLFYLFLVNYRLLIYNGITISTVVMKESLTPIGIMDQVRTISVIQGILSKVFTITDLADRCNFTYLYK